MLSAATTADLFRTLSVRIWHNAVAMSQSGTRLQLSRNSAVINKLTNYWIRLRHFLGDCGMDVVPSAAVMKRIVDNLHIDLIAAGLMIGMMATGYVLRFPLPPGSNKSLVLWGLTRHQWGDIHFWISTGLLAVILLHICLHWQWVHISVKRLFSQAKARGTHSLLSGLTTLVGFVLISALFAWAAQIGVKPMEDRRDGVCPTPESDAAENTPDERRNSLGGSADVAQAQVTFSKDVYPLLERACLSCHGPKTQRSNFRIDRKEDFSRELGGMPLVVPGKSAESSLVTLLSGLRKDIARPEVHRLPPDQVAVLRAWIDAGAQWDMTRP